MRSKPHPWLLRTGSSGQRKVRNEDECWTAKNKYSAQIVVLATSFFISVPYKSILIQSMLVLRLYPLQELKSPNQCSTSMNSSLLWFQPEQNHSTRVCLWFPNSCLPFSEEAKAESFVTRGSLDSLSTKASDGSTIPGLSQFPNSPGGRGRITQWKATTCHWEADSHSPCCFSWEYCLL